MRKLLVLIVAISVLGVCSAPAVETAPDWALISSEGKLIRLGDEVQQQPVVLFFWATWCPYCKALMPHLQSMQLEYGDAIKILAISIRESGDPVGYLKEKGYDFTALPDGDEVAALYDIYGTPGIVIIDGDQKIIFDLRQLPPYNPPRPAKKINHSKSAAFRAPYWAAAIRLKIDTVVRPADL